MVDVLFKKQSLLVLFLLGTLCFNGCSEKSYPADQLEHDLIEICKKEYGVEDIKVQIAGTTIGVYLPLKQLFASNFKEAIMSGKVSNVETLFEPSQDAMDKVEDVLFSISRVLLSTDKKLDFYVLQATDVESTGLQLILKGYVDDIKRVRVWDIPRSEYRKRVIHELRLNQAVIWQKPVLGFFEKLPVLKREETRDQYLDATLPVDLIQKLFYDPLKEDAGPETVTEWKVHELRSMELNRRSAVIYVNVEPQIAAGFESAMTTRRLEYLFIINFTEDKDKIARIIPFQFRNKQGEMESVEFPPELEVAKSLKRWNQEFNVKPMVLGEFLSDQLSRRVQTILASDERIRNTVREAKVEFTYVDEEPSHFSLHMDVSLRDLQAHGDEDSIVRHEDMLYILDLTSREFVDVMRSYRFKDYEYLSLNLLQEPATWVSAKEDLELFRKNKIDVRSLFSSFMNV